MNIRLERILSGSVIALVMLLAFPGCEALKKSVTKPAPKEVTINSYTMILEGYQETVTVNASAKELSDFLSGPNELLFRDLEYDKTIPALGEDEVGPGTSIFYVYSRGLVVPGRLIVLRLDDKDFWYISHDHPNFNFARWRFELAADGIRLTWEGITEITDDMWTRFLEFMLPQDYWYESQDMFMAQIQAHFDPSEDVEKLLSHGLRGDVYRAAVQVHEASVWIDAPVDKVEQSLNDPAIMSPVLGESENGCLSQTLPKGRTLYCPAMIDHEGRPVAMENFGTDHTSEEEHRRRYHQVALDLVGHLEIVFNPEGKGTRLNVIWKWEMPEAAAPESMEQSIFIANTPQKLHETANRIKAGAESLP